MMKHSKTIWILEDDKQMQFVFQTIFTNNYNLQFFDSIASLQGKLKHTHDLPNLILADLRLPDGYFYNYLSALKKEISHRTRIIIISVLSDIQIMKKCMDLGVDDFLTKPLNKNEILFKVEKIITCKSINMIPGEVAINNNLSFCPINHYLNDKISNKSIELTRIEVKLLYYLSIHPHISKDILKIKVWGNIAVTKNTIDVSITRLRKKISPFGLKIEINSTNNFNLGYRMNNING